MYKLFAVLVIALIALTACVSAATTPANDEVPVRVEIVNPSLPVTVEDVVKVDVAGFAGFGSSNGTDSPEQPTPQAVERVGIIDTNGQGVATWGGAFTAYSDAGVTSKFNVAGTTGNVVTSGSVQVGTFLYLVPASTVALGANGTITPAGTLQPITSTVAVTTSASTAVADGSTAGAILILQNMNASNTIIVDGAGANVECGGNQSLGAKDSITLRWDGSDWHCISKFGF